MAIGGFPKANCPMQQNKEEWPQKYGLVQTMARTRSLPMANLQSKRGRGRPRKLLAPAQQSSLTRDFSKRPRKLSEFVLPAGWTKEVITRKNGKYTWRKDLITFLNAIFMS